MQKHKESNSRYSDPSHHGEFWAGFGMAIWVFGWIFAAVFAMFQLVKYLINPEWYAITKILGLIPGN